MRCAGMIPSGAECRENGMTARFVTGCMALFWTFNAAYQALRPAPFPAPLRLGFLALAILLALLYFVALLRRDA
jgi:hypothetical protein